MASRRLAVMGLSRGGELALLLGSRFRDIDRVVAYVASGVIHGEPLEPGDTRAASAWSENGAPLPYLQQDNTTDDASAVDDERAPVDGSPRYLSQLRDARAVERSTIPVERINGPVMLVSGKDDRVWPSSELSEITMRRLMQHRHRFPFVHLSYESAGHRFYPPYVPTTIVAIKHPVNGVEYALGGTPEGNAAAAEDSWPKVLAFLAGVN
jgi:dienelactone hydrolase